MSAISLKPVEPTLAARIERAAHMVYMHGAREDEVAEALGIKGVTLRDWKRRPEWSSAIGALRDAQMQIAGDRLAMLTEKAVEAIAESIDSDNATVRLKAATWVLERADLGLAPDGPTEFELYVRTVRGHGG